jgi:CHAT domain-containing protein/Tfp pilus assembly protein PilF
MFGSPNTIIHSIDIDGLQPGLVVESVAKNGQAEIAGMHEGDVLLSWVGTDTKKAFHSPFEIPYVELDQGSRGVVRIEGSRNGTRRVWLLTSPNWGIRARPRLPASLLSCYEQGHVLLRTGAIAEAVKIWRTAGETAQSQQLWGVKPWFLARIAQQFVQMGQWDDAYNTYREAAELSPEVGPEIKTELYRQWADILEFRDDLVAAESLYQKMLEERQRLASDSMAVASALLNLAVVSLKEGDLSIAEGYLHQSLELEQKLAPQSLQFAATLLDLGVIAQNRGDLAQAEYYYRHALSIQARTALVTADYSMMLKNIASVQYQRGDILNAERNLRHALAIVRTLKPDSLEEATVLSDLGQCLAAQNKLAEAERYENKSLAIRQERAPGSLTVVFSLAALGKISFARGAMNQAEKHYRDALEIAENVPAAHPELAIPLAALGAILLGRNNLLEAEVYYRRALEILEKEPVATAEHAEILGALAGLARKQNRIKAADQLYSQALDEFEQQVNQLGGAPSDHFRYRAKYHDFYREYLDLLVEQREVERAFKMSEASRARAFTEMLATAHIDVRKGLDPDLLASERLLHSEIQVKSERKLQLLAAQNEPQVKQIEQELNSLLVRYNEIREQLYLRSPHSMALTRPKLLDVANVQGELLDQDSMLLEYALGKQKSYVFAVTSSSIRVFELPKDVVIEKLAFRFYKLLTSTKSGSEYREVAAELSKIILGPVAPLLGSKRLLIVCDGALQYIPFAALPSPATISSGKEAQSARGIPPFSAQSSSRQNDQIPTPLMIEHEIVNLPSAAVLAEIRKEEEGRPEPPKAVAVLADPVFDAKDARVLRSAAFQSAHEEQKDNASLRGSSPSPMALQRAISDFGGHQRGNSYLNRLIYTRQEALSIIAVTPAGRRMQALDFQASRAMALSPSLADYRIIHFATHGLLNNEHPDLSGLVFSLVDKSGRPQDGFLQLQDIYDLHLPVNLVVLSACNTAVGQEIKGEGLLGLTRGFMYAGASRVVASLWSVNDAATSELMSRFYKAMERDGLRPAAALRAAQIGMLKQRKWAAPLYWAGFQIQGEWR